MRVFLFACKENHSFKSLRLFLKAKKQPPVCLRPGKREKYWPFYFIVLYVYHGCLFLLFVLLKSHRLNTKWLWYEIVALVHKNPNSGPYRKDGFSHECDTFCGFLRSDLSAPSRFYLPVSISFPWISVSCFPALAPAQRKRPAGHQRPAGLLEKMRNAQKEKSRGLSACSSIWILIIKGTGIILLRQPVCLCIYRSSGILCERV